MEDQTDSVNAPSEMQARSGPAFDRIIGNIANTAVATWVTLNTGSPEAGATLGGVAGPLAEELSNAVRKAIGVQQAQGQVMISDAADIAQLLPNDFLDLLTQDPVRLQLLLRALQAAAESATAAKLRNISELLAAGALADQDAQIDELTVALETIRGLETPHFRILLILKNPTPEWWDSALDRDRLRRAWSEEKITEQAPGLGRALTTLIAKLQSLGLIREVSPYPERRPLWEITPFGNLCIAAMIDAPGNSGRSSASDE